MRISLSILLLYLSTVQCLPSLFKPRPPGLKDLPKEDVDVYPFFKREAMVRLDYGTFLGRDVRKTRQYFGIPYAAPPVGDLRFMHPQPPVKFYGVKKAFKHGNGCFQDPLAPPLFGVALNRSEDCLNLSIWAPEGHSEEDEKIPVMVWLLPGGFTSGYVSNPLYNGGNIVRNAKEKVMIVSFNYRMGLFGWTASREFQEAGLVNMGMRDIIAAFEWVKKYIHKFGGDANRITAFGESAGGILVSCLLFINSGTQNLFNFAIIESGTSGYTIPTLPEFEKGYDTIFHEIGCDRNTTNVIECMKKLPPEIMANNSLTEHAESFPVIDGDLFIYQPIDAVSKGLISRVPMLIGSTTNEGTFFATRGVNTEEDVIHNMKWILPFLTDPEIKTVIGWYPLEKFLSPFYQAAEIIGDRFFYCPTIDLAMGLARMDVPVYKYRFNEQPVLARWIHFFFGRLGVFHFSEIPFIFPLRFLQLGREERRLSDTMVNAWVTFAKTGVPILSSPSTNEYIPWPRYLVNDSQISQSRINVVLHAPVSNILIENDVHKDEICLKWRQIEKHRSI